MSDKRKAGFYWVDVRRSYGVAREVCEWDGGGWLIAGISCRESDGGFEISNINGEMIEEG